MFILEKLYKAPQIQILSYANPFLKFQASSNCYSLNELTSDVRNIINFIK